MVMLYYLFNMALVCNEDSNILVFQSLYSTKATLNYEDTFRKEEMEWVTQISFNDILISLCISLKLNINWRASYNMSAPVTSMNYLSLSALPSNDEDKIFVHFALSVLS